MSNETTSTVVTSLLIVIDMAAFGVYVAALCTGWSYYAVSDTTPHLNLSAVREWPQLFFSRSQYLSGQYCFSDVADSECKC